MAQLATGIVGGQQAWGLIGIGAAFGLALILCGARSLMLIAVGLYLPFKTDTAIFLGGLMRWAADALAKDRPSAEEKGTLLAAGLIAGEALLGILLAILAVRDVPPIASFSFVPTWGGWLSLIGFAALAWALIRLPQKPVKVQPTAC
jgi:uncharacterized oligopeptide transporter (OPT) family protein